MHSAPARPARLPHEEDAPQQVGVRRWLPVTVQVRDDADRDARVSASGIRARGRPRDRRQKSDEKDRNHPSGMRTEER